MNIDMGQLAIGLGILVNLSALVAIAMKFERRFTSLEIHVHYLREDINKMPRRVSDCPMVE